MAKSFLSRLNPFNKQPEVSPEVKILKDKLEAALGEFNDSMNFEAKFFETEGSNATGGAIEISGIDQTVDAATLQKLYISESWVYIAVNAIAQTISGLPIKLERSKIIKRKVENEVTGDEEIVEEEVWVDASSEKLAKLFQFPNEFSSKSEFYNLLMIDLLTAGEYFVWLDSDTDLSIFEGDMEADRNTAFGRLANAMSANSPVKALYRIPASMMEPIPKQEGFGIEGYMLNSGTGKHAFHASEIIHVKLPNPLDPYRGLSPLVAALKPILIDRYSTEHMIRFYKSGARLGGVITTDKGLNKDQLSRFQRSFENNYTGRNNHHRTLILPPGMKYEPVEQNPAQLALLDYSKKNREDILAVFRVPPIKAGIIDGSNYANARAQIKTFYRDTVIPTLTFVEDGFNRKRSLMPGDHTCRMRFDVSSVEELQDDGLAQANLAKGMLDSGLTVNEVRKRVWKSQPIKDGDQSPVIAEMERSAINTAIGLGQAANIDPSEALEDAGAEVEASAQTAGEIKDAPSGPGTSITPTDCTFEQRVSMLVAQYVQEGMPLSVAVPKALAQAKLEGFNPEDPEDPTDPDGSSPPDGSSEADETISAPPAEVKSEGLSLDQFIQSRLASLGDAPVTDELIKELTEEYNAGSKEEQIAVEIPKIYANGDSKEAVTSNWKSFVEKTDPLIVKRAVHIQKFFKKFESAVLNRLGANVKSYGLMKARDSDDIEDILDIEKDLAEAIKEYSSKVDSALESALKYGHAETLPGLKLRNLSGADIAGIIKDYLGENINGIVDTTKEQIKRVLAAGFESGKSIGDISKDIQAKFTEIGSGRAVTIARTETLTAVSMGRAAKREEAKKEFPNRKIRKMWVSAKDDLVRETHEELDGTSVAEGEAFENGLMYPRDPAGEAKEVINCRCTDISYFEEQESEISQELDSE